MNFRLLFVGLPLLAVGWASAASLASARPDITRQYRFVPLRSVLTEVRPSGDVDYRVRGRFDVSFTYANMEAWQATAMFENVRAWASHPIQDNVLDLNDVLGLEDLIGEQLPTLAPWDAFSFEGKNSDGSAVRLYAKVIGDWFALDGGATPGPDRPDLPAYEIHAWARARPFADFNDDGSVTIADLEIWKSHVGQTWLTHDATSLGDADGDGDVDGGDFLAWQSHAGQNWLPGAAAASAAVPEPGMAAIALSAALGCAAVRRRHASFAPGH